MTQSETVFEDCLIPADLTFCSRQLFSPGNLASFSVSSGPRLASPRSPPGRSAGGGWRGHRELAEGARITWQLVPSPGMPGRGRGRMGEGRGRGAAGEKAGAGRPSDAGDGGGGRSR